MQQFTAALAGSSLLNLLLLGDAVTLVTNSSLTARFRLFVQEHRRGYDIDSTEFQTRLQYFQDRIAAVDLQNSKPDRRWTAAINHLSDRSPEEMKALNGWRGGAAYSEPRLVSSAFLQAGGKRKALPESKDWTKLWMAQPAQVHNQHCGDCWAAATASLLEAHAEIHTGKKRHFSFEEITKCTENPFACGGDGGCGGATPELALQQVMVNGIGHEESASSCASKNPAHIVDKNEGGPHEWGAGVRTATGDAKGRAIGMIGWERLPVNKNEPLMRALVERGPVAVAVATDWRDYGSGIYDGCMKNAEISHSVLAMGYGADAKTGDKYWLIQNSWGTSFGENGHMRLLRHDKEEDWCGVDSRPELGTTCRGGPSKVTVCGMCGILFDTTVPHFESSI